MKKLVNPLSTGGAPLYGTETFSEILTQEVWDAIEATYESLTPSAYHDEVTTDNMVLSGGEITDVGGGLFDVAAGIAYFKSAGGIIARFPALASVNPTVSTIYINLEAPVTEQKTFFDATPKDYAITHSAVVAITAATDYVTGFADTGGDTFFPTLQWILDSIEAKQAGLFAGMGLYQQALPTWDMDAVAFIDIAIPDGIAYPSKSKIISLHALIRKDPGLSRKQFNIDVWDPGISEASGLIQIDEDLVTEEFTVRISRTAGSIFDDTDYNDTAESRGQLFIVFIPDSGYSPY